MRELCACGQRSVIVGGEGVAIGEGVVVVKRQDQ